MEGASHTRVVLAELRRLRLHRARRASRAVLAFAPSLERDTARDLAELSRSVSSDWDATIRRIVQFDADRLHVERVSFWSLDEDASSTYCDAAYVSSVGSFERGATVFVADQPEYFEALRTERTLNMGDVQSDPRCRGLRDYCASRGITSMLDVPVWLEGRLSGVLCHEHVGAIRRWDAPEEIFATSVGQVVSSALAARAHTRAEAAAHRAAFLDTVSRVLSLLDAREVANHAVNLCVPRFAAVALLWVQDRDGVLECLAMKHRDPIDEEVLVRWRQARAGLPGCGIPYMASRVTRQGQSLLLPEMTPAMLERYGFAAVDISAIHRLGLRTAICAPLTIGSHTFGAMTFFASDRRYHADDLELAESIAGRVAAALENARLYAVAREAIQARDDLLVLAAHELRTPLTALQLRTEHLLRRAARHGADPDETARSEGIARDVRRFSALVNHMLNALNIRAEGVALTPGPCDLATIVRDRVARVAERAPAAAGTIALECAAAVTGWWDRALVEKAIDVLLDNAVKFGSGRPITVSLRAESRHAELAVRDQGIGISPDRLSAIFLPFERAVPKEHFGGLGLGLFIAKAIVDAHGGSIAVTSRPGEGSTFVLRLPLAAEGGGAAGASST